MKYVFCHIFYLPFILIKMYIIKMKEVFFQFKIAFELKKRILIKKRIRFQCTFNFFSF